MSAPGVSAATAWIYRGLWGAIVRWFRVPRDPPSLPGAHAERVESFRPAPGYLRYLKFWFWLVLFPMDLPVFIVWGILAWQSPRWAALLAPVALLIAFLPDILAYVSIHLRYDTTWYVVSDRTLRIRRGIVTIRELTITFENVQNVKVEQGPVERRFGIGRVIVETAGVSAGVGAKGVGSGANQAILLGIDDLEGMKARILQHVRRSKSAGLGDERSPGAAHHGPVAGAWTRAHIDALREIKHEIVAMRA